MAESKLREQAMEFSVEIIKLVKYLKDQRETIIVNQIGRSGTSIGANIYETLDRVLGGRILYPNWKLL